jgi:uncharacterized iron-regulated protein
MPALRSLPCLLLTLAVLLVGLHKSRFEAAGPPESNTALEATLRKLEKDIEKVRGLAFKKPVLARVIPRPKETPGHLQGYYSTKEKTLFVYDDIRGNYERGVLIHEMVHALQDQHFGLEKLHPTAYGSDGELARAALIEGDATWTMIELLKKDQPRVAMMLEAPLEKARDLDRAFLYAQGTRYVKALQERGGWNEVNMRYRFPPSATASILHPETRVVSIDLGPGAVRGELGLIRLLASSPATAAESVQAAAGWRGDRTIEEGKARAWVVAFGSSEQAGRFQAALVKYHASKTPGEKPQRQSVGEVVWKRDGGVLGVLAHDSRVLQLEAPDEKGLTAMLDRIEGPPPVTIYSSKDKKTISFGELVDRLMEADLVCIGENHDSELTHRMQLQLIRAIHARDERLGVGMEMFQKPYQKHLDRYLSGAIDESTFLEDTEYRRRWGFEWSLYQPIVRFCKNNKVPLAALNVAEELRGRISKVGVKALTAEEKKQLGDIDYQVKAHRDYWYERLAKMHGDSKVSEERKERSYEVMTTWDGYMASSAASFQQDRKLRRMVVLAGSGHIDRGFGIPERAARRTGGKASTIHIDVGGKLEKLQADPPADFILVVR